ncbi:aminoglycoside phosphotransferase [Paenibacillus sp. PK3_47]|uniref:phosphotransferase n=1 Tax=Paenibacillus sp. PK3_47 TaxID=2072642 RepID=UPI00201E2455|nr:phosphotransferase [Paenibacillus sp. PK3_47]UQZ34974.1 aminoglycoside phosphotransferase [Paenibacillus sp. PK3_47]
MGLTITNETKLPIEERMDQLYIGVGNLFSRSVVEITTVTCEDLGYATPNFTTAGVYHLHGHAIVDHVPLPWSLILKIIQQDSGEKENPQHHNYWRREALVLQSGILKELPESVRAPECYLVQEQPDGTIWLWMERVEGEVPASLEQFESIAFRLGCFNGAYLTGKELPRAEWICQSWLKSWTAASRKYAPSTESYTSRLHTKHELDIWAWYKDFDRQIGGYLNALERLPRVLAHQDLSQMNMLLAREDFLDAPLMLIDWQFMSISGIGEDLGKLYGVNMSLGIIPENEYEVFREALFTSYMQGLRSAGWRGLEVQARYGFCVSTALRSVWEVPQFFAAAGQLEHDPHNTGLEERYTRLTKIIQVHRQMAGEADRIQRYH